MNENDVAAINEIVRKVAEEGKRMDEIEKQIGSYKSIVDELQTQKDSMLKDISMLKNRTKPEIVQYGDNKYVLSDDGKKLIPYNEVE